MATIARRMNVAGMRPAAPDPEPAPSQRPSQRLPVPGPARRAAPANPPAPAAPPTTRAPQRTAPQVERAGRGTVDVEARDRREDGPYHAETYEQEVGRGRFAADHPPAHVIAKLGITINMQNFESLRIDVSVSLPVDNNPQAIEAGYYEANEFCIQKIQEEEARWLGGNDFTNRRS